MNQALLPEFRRERGKIPSQGRKPKLMPLVVEPMDTFDGVFAGSNPWPVPILRLPSGFT